MAACGSSEGRCVICGYSLCSQAGLRQASLGWEAKDQWCRTAQLLSSFELSCVHLAVQELQHLAFCFSVYVPAVRGLQAWMQAPG